MSSVPDKSENNKSKKKRCMLIVVVLLLIMAGIALGVLYYLGDIFSDPILPPGPQFLENPMFGIY